MSKEYLDEIEKTENEASDLQWLLSFSDLLALMLTFFILLYSMKTIPQNKWQSLVHSFHKQFKSEHDTSSYMVPSFEGLDHLNVQPAINLDYLKSVLESRATRNEVFATLRIDKNDDELTISMSGDTLFPKGSASLTDPAHEVISTIANILEKIDNEVRVVGHTDPEPITTELFPSNWELSLARASAVTQALQSYGGITTAESIGVADGFYEELDQELSAAAMDQRARRVDIVIKELASVNLLDDTEKSDTISE